MVKLNKIYTKTGDGGNTALGDGERVLKDSLRVSAYGNVDELNASIGVITLYANTELKRKLKNIQNDLFDIGADLCVPISEKNKDRLRLSTNQIETLELEIDEMNSIQNPSKTVLQAIGMNLSSDLEENINLKTNRLAKKQLTWFKQEDRIKIIETNDELVVKDELERIIDEK